VPARGVRAAASTPVRPPGRTPRGPTGKQAAAPPGELNRRRRDDLADAALRSRIHGPPTSVATRFASLTDAKSGISTRCVSSTRTTRAAAAPASPDAPHDDGARLLRLRGERVAQVQMAYHDSHPATV
jgi:hypothetical protein